MCFLCLVDAFLYFVFFFKQKTAYEMRISDWSSDVCSSDLAGAVRGDVRRHVFHVARRVRRRRGSAAAAAGSRGALRHLPWPLPLRRQGEAGRGCPRFGLIPKGTPPQPSPAFAGEGAKLAAEAAPTKATSKGNINGLRVRTPHPARAAARRW